MFLKDTGVTVTVQVRGEEVQCKVRLVDQYGMFPLSPGHQLSRKPHGWMTNRFYASGPQEGWRRRSSLVLGVSGALRALKIPVDVYHFNEGHAVLAGIELIRKR